MPRGHWATQIAVASGSSSEVVLEQATESFAAFHLAAHGTDFLIGFDQPVAQPLMIPIGAS